MILTSKGTVMSRRLPVQTTMVVIMAISLLDTAVVMELPGDEAEGSNNIETIMVFDNTDTIRKLKTLAYIDTQFKEMRPY